MIDRVAVVLFNLGGPDSLEAVRPFLFNLFNDRAIIGLPTPLRWLLARLVSSRRAKVARHIYAQLGGSSPLLRLTRDQARSLERRLVERGHGARTFCAMRYWHPMGDAVAAEIKAWDPDKIVLLPLYPQFSTTTSNSSLKDWSSAASRAGLNVPMHAVCCYPDHPGFVTAIAELTSVTVEVQAPPRPLRLLFSAHGLPKRVIARGDPYQWQVEKTVGAVVSQLGDLAADHVICYQSRVGPLEWIGPAIEAELERAARDQVAVVVVPVAFVSEHSETLVELDIEYRTKAQELGVPTYIRVPTVGTAEAFIDALVDLVEDALTRRTGPCPSGALPDLPSLLRRLSLRLRGCKPVG